MRICEEWATRKRSIMTLKGSFQSLHWHHNIWIQFRNRCISNMQILSGKGLVIVLAPFIVAEIFKWILCHVYGKITKSVRSTSFLWEMKKNEGYERFHFHLNSFSSSSREQVQGVLSWIWQEYHHISLFIGETNGVLARKLWSYPSWDVRTPLLDFLIMGSTLTCPNRVSQPACKLQLIFIQ